MKFSLFVTTLFAFCLQAQAQVVFSPGISYSSRTTEQTQPTNQETEFTELRADLRLGYVLPMGLYLGGMYSYFSQDFGATDQSGYNMGATVGYYSMSGFYSLLTYHFIGELGDDAKYTGGSGPQVDVGWVFPITSSFSIGPQFTWRSLDYTTLESGAVEIDTDYNETSIEPYLSLWFMF